jgi:hypothetical protein
MRTDGCVGPRMASSCSSVKWTVLPPRESRDGDEVGLGPGSDGERGLGSPRSATMSAKSASCAPYEALHETSRH